MIFSLRWWADGENDGCRRRPCRSYSCWPIPKPSFWSLLIFITLLPKLKCSRLDNLERFQVQRFWWSYVPLRKKLHFRSKINLNPRGFILFTSYTSLKHLRIALKKKTLLQTGWLQSKRLDLFKRPAIISSIAISELQSNAIRDAALREAAMRDTASGDVGCGQETR